jgi:hypothetical protein
VGTTHLSCNFPRELITVNWPSGLVFLPGSYERKVCKIVHTAFVPMLQDNAGGPTPQSGVRNSLVSNALDRKKEYLSGEKAFIIRGR